MYIREYLYIQGGKQGFDRKIFSAHALHHYMKSRIIIQHYAILSGIVMGKQAVFTKTQAVNIIYILRKNFKQISFIYWNDFNFFSAGIVA